MQKQLTFLLIIGILLNASCSSDSTNSNNNNEVETVKIGYQIWMKKNLEVSRYRNGDPIYFANTADDWTRSGAKGIGAWCYYNNNTGTGRIYGKLYNWYAVNDPRGLAPEGWRIADNNDWLVLNTNLGISSASQLAGSKDLWNEGDLINNSAFNITGFNALPGGMRSYGGDFTGLGHSAYWWSYDEYNSEQAYRRYIAYNSANIGRDHNFKWEGYSVRCIK